MDPATHTIVVGAGPAGLAVAAGLGSRGVPYTLLERSEDVGWSWRNHYERLHLHTVKQFSSLPGMRFPEHVGLYPSRDEVVAYLEAYARRFKVTPRLGEGVQRARREHGLWHVETDRGTHRAKNLVLATGYNRVPREVRWPGQEAFQGTVLHSREFRSGRPFQGKRVLVVGMGNTGGELALDLWESGATVALAVRSPRHVVPRDVYGIPAQVNSLFVLSRLPIALADRLSLRLLDRVVGDLAPYGLPRPSEGPLTQVVERGRIPLIDIGTIALVKQGKLPVLPPPERFTPTGVVHADGVERPWDAVLAATGYHPGLEELLEGASQVLNERGYPRVHGAESALPGLYFLGFRNPLTGQLHDIAREARRITAALGGA
ncbi:MAG: NAD(P)/FAD-dependent oxidoreductase [Deltaproteobacteria bacterium]|nr:NAD(P)/FAD-dependent oxidoreductase [Deltaproteobacteria bacterium]